MEAIKDKKESWEYGFWFNIWNWFDIWGLIHNGGLSANRNFYPNLLIPGEYIVVEVVTTVMNQFRLDLKNSKGEAVKLLFTLEPEIQNGVTFRTGQKFKIERSDLGQGRKNVLTMIM